VVAKMKRRKRNSLSQIKIYNYCSSIGKCVAVDREGLSGIVIGLEKRVRIVTSGTNKK